MTTCDLVLCRQEPDQAVSLPSRLAALDTWLINAAAAAESSSQRGPQSGSQPSATPSRRLARRELRTALAGILPPPYPYNAADVPAPGGVPVAGAGLGLKPNPNPTVIIAGSGPPAEGQASQAAARQTDGREHGLHPHPSMGLQQQTLGFQPPPLISTDRHALPSNQF